MTRRLLAGLAFALVSCAHLAHLAPVYPMKHDPRCTYHWGDNPVGSCWCEKPDRPVQRVHKYRCGKANGNK